MAEAGLLDKLGPLLYSDLGDGCPHGQMDFGTSSSLCICPEGGDLGTDLVSPRVLVFELRLSLYVPSICNRASPEFARSTLVAGELLVAFPFILSVGNLSLRYITVLFARSPVVCLYPLIALVYHRAADRFLYNGGALHSFSFSDAANGLY